jgi:hypothetical protein
MCSIIGFGDRIERIGNGLLVLIRSICSCDPLTVCPLIILAY